MPSLSTRSINPDETKIRVQDFWEDEPCGSGHAEAPEGTREYFDQVERRRN
jgi:hypothetical protein